MDQEPAAKGLEVSPLFVAILGVIVGAIVLTILHCITVNLCFRTQTLSHRQQHLGFGRRTQEQDEETPSGNLENYTVHLIPVRRYSKDGASMGENDEPTCAVCLAEFVEGEEVRILPECTHSFHVPCIDMWLYSHSSCPLCRTNTMPPQGPAQPFRHQQEIPRPPDIGG